MVVFTDLDGTLLDDQSYSWAAAEPALRALRERDIPVVLVSSKTIAELQSLRERLDLPHPVVAENGAIVDVPENYFGVEQIAVKPSVPRADIQTAYSAVKADGNYQCQAFFEMGPQIIAEHTGLSLAQATLANRRSASEPILWLDSEDNARVFIDQLTTRGLRCVHGGRFLHVMSNTSKGEAVRRLIAAYQQIVTAKTLVSVACGDAPNDLDMLASTDVAVMIPGHHVHSMVLDAGNRVVRPARSGPSGWNEAILTLLAEL
ncbi:MAG: HAD-IIB family hydrolase [Pseudomonadota bacterium]